MSTFNWVGWKLERVGDKTQITAPCGCSGTGPQWTPRASGVVSIPDDTGDVTFDFFDDCGMVESCVFRKKIRALAFRRDIPTDGEMWEYIQQFEGAK